MHRQEGAEKRHKRRHVLDANVVGVVRPLVHVKNVLLAQDLLVLIQMTLVARHVPKRQSNAVEMRDFGQALKNGRAMMA